MNKNINILRLTPFLFSKERDSSSGLYYYGYRFYSPELGRWINRDPIEEVQFHNTKRIFSDTVFKYKSERNLEILQSKIFQGTEWRKIFNINRFNGEGQNYNRYLVNNNNPQNYIDVEGDISLWIPIIIVGGITGIVLADGAIEAFCGWVYEMCQTTLEKPWEIIGEMEPNNPWKDKGKEICTKLGRWGPVHGD